jgi:PAS domain S-box-containing protein
MPRDFPFANLGDPALLGAIREAAGNAGIGLAVTVSDLDPPRVLYLNGRAEELLGRTRDEVDAIGIWGCIAPEQVPELKLRHQLRLRGEPVALHYEATIVHPSGERVPVQMTHSATFVDDHVVVVTFLFDIRERKRAMDALDESKRRFQHVVENAPDGVAVLRGPVIGFLNERAARMLGLERAIDGYGRLITEFLHPEDAERARDRILELVRTNQRYSEPAEYRSRSADGRELHVEISSIPIELDGEAAVVAFARDVTERRSIQAKLVQADRLASLGVLSAGVAHEINNPLAYVLLNLEFLEREIEKLGVKPEKLDSLKNRLHDARHGAERVATIVRDLRTFARGDEGARGPVRLTSVIESALNIANAEIEPRARIVRRYDEVPPADANANRLEQVFLNLLLNAAQAIPAGGAPENHRIEITVRRAGNSVCADVRDTGVGMSGPILEKIFDPFFTTKPAGVGTGLGLPICQSIVRALGGDLSVKSAPGEGSCFTVSLPIWDGDPHPILTPLPVPPIPVAPRGRVLIVDDEVAVGRTLALVLSSEHEVTVTTSAAEALRFVREQGAGVFDAVLCDLLMPGMTGIEFYQTVQRELPELAGRFLFMTGGLAPRKLAGQLSSQTPLFEKPFDLDQIRATLRAFVRERRGTKSPPPQ